MSRLSKLVLVRVTGPGADVVALDAVRIALAHGQDSVHEYGSGAEYNTVSAHDFEALLTFDDQPTPFHLGQALSKAAVDRPEMFDEEVSEPVYREGLRGSASDVETRRRIRSIRSGNAIEPEIVTTVPPFVVDHVNCRSTFVPFDQLTEGPKLSETYQPTDDDLRGSVEARSTPFALEEGKALSIEVRHERYFSLP